MKKIGVFEIRTSFNVSYRGIVAVGTFIEGNALVGSIATIDIEGKAVLVKIKGVESGNIDSNGKLPFGLLLSFDNESLLQIVERDRLIQVGQQVTLRFAEAILSSLYQRFMKS